MIRRVGEDHLAHLSAKANRYETRDPEDRQTLGPASNRNEIGRVCKQRRVPHRRRGTIEQAHRVYKGTERADREIRRHSHDEQRNAAQYHHSSSVCIRRASSKGRDRDRAHRLRRHDAANLSLASSKLLQKTWKMHEQKRGEIHQRVGERRQNERASEQRRHAVGTSRHGTPGRSRRTGPTLYYVERPRDDAVASLRHSARSVEIGSTRLARIAGSAIAPLATTLKT